MQWTKAHGTLLLAVSLDAQEIGRRLAAARGRKHWTQLEFALEANVSPSTIARWESGKLPPVRELIRVADLLEIDPDVLVEPEEIKEDLRLDRFERLLETVLETVQELREELRDARREETPTLPAAHAQGE
jgi:transcriptional regulator with XRE-family HTH domain